MAATTTLTDASDVLDIRAIPPHDRHPVIFSRFNALAVGQSLQLLNDHNPQPLRAQFEDRVFGQFEWVVLESGPVVWQVQITRVADASAPSAGVSGDSCCSGGACSG
jgi:uncharacterized protein (DUF2249 family)